MDKEKEIEEMAKELHCATSESFLSCRKIARILVERCGYGNVKQAVKEFAERLYENVQNLEGDGWDEYNEGFKRGIHETMNKMYDLITELYGADE